MSRKYRQQGYDDRSSGPSSSGRKAPQGPKPRREGPRGRGQGAERQDVFRCRDCGTQRLISQPIEADTVCAKCAAALHSCVNCQHFDSSARWECRQPIEKPQRSKTKANDCEFFSEKVVQEFASDVNRASDAKAAFDALFDF